MQNYEEVLSLDDDPRFGSIKILCDPTNPRSRIMKKKEIFQTKEDLNKYELIAKKKVQILQPRIQILQDYNVDKENLIIEFYYEYLDEFLVLKELQKEEVLKLFQDICEALIQNTQIGQDHGDIRPEMVSFNSLKDFYLLEKKDQQKQISDLQRDNIKTYKPIYISPEFFERLMRHQRLTDIDMPKSDLFSLGFMCLEAFEEHDFLQEFYNFNKGMFDYISMQDKLELILKRNLPSQVYEFLNFLKHYILVDQSKRLTPEEALDFIIDIREGKKLFESTDQQQTDLNENVQYYNPFDFLNTSDLITRTVSIDNRQNRNQSPSQNFDFRHRDESLIDISQNAKVHKSMGQNNILVVTQNQSDQIQSSQNGSDIRDILENLKYFKLKLKEPVIKESSPINFQGLFYPITRKKSQIQISQESKRKTSQQSHDEEMYAYLQNIGLKPDVQENNQTSDLDKKLRETAKFDNQADLLNFDQQTKGLENNKGKSKIVSLRGFLKNSAQEHELKIESKIKSAKKIDKGFSIFQNKKQKKEDQRQKSARKLMIDNYNIIEKKSQNNIFLHKGKQSYEINSFNQSQERSLLSEDNKSIQDSIQDSQEKISHNIMNSIQQTNLDEIDMQTKNQIKTPKRNYQSSSLQYLNQKETTKQYKQENSGPKIREINSASSQTNNTTKIINQNFAKKNDAPSKIISIKTISINQPQDIKNIKASNFLDCYNDKYLQQCSQKIIKPFKQNQNSQKIYNIDNLKERESWKNFQQDNQQMNANLHLYQKIQNNNNKQYQIQQPKYIPESQQKTLKNTTIITPLQQSQVEDRQSTKWINSVIPSQKNIYQNQNIKNYNFYKKN